MSPGADLFVVCKQCGAEVSSYVTECPYCGHRLRRRAPKLPRERSGRKGLGRLRGPPRHRRLPAPSLGRLRRGEIPGIAAEPRPYATIALVSASAVLWIAWQAGLVSFANLAIVGPLQGQWWRLVTSQFAYTGGFSGFMYAFTVLGTVAVFGWLLEQRYGAVVVLALFLGAGATGALAALAIYPQHAIVSGANSGALALLAAWAAPDLVALSRRSYYDGDLLGAAAIAAALLAMPFARPEASWVAGLTGGLLGLAVGVGLARVRSDAL
jgi:membrane associated rhomboid family serine protease